MGFLWLVFVVYVAFPCVMTLPSECKVDGICISLGHDKQPQRRRGLVPTEGAEE